jgi:GNAT superfamily N-acetyltransferase
MIPSDIPVIDKGFYSAPEGAIATIVTVLEKKCAEKIIPLQRNDVDMVEVLNPGLAWYRTLFTKVGAPWLWSSRLRLDDLALERIIRASTTKIFAARLQGGKDNEKDVGFAELDFFSQDQCEITFFGLLKEYTGRGLGRFMMMRALSAAQSKGANHIHLHTCTLDDKRALDFYLKCGFRPVRQAVEILEDPRECGLLPS